MLEPPPNNFSGVREPIFGGLFKKGDGTSLFQDVQGDLERKRMQGKNVGDFVTQPFPFQACHASPVNYPDFSFSLYLRSFNPSCIYLNFLPYCHSDSVNRGSTPFPPANYIKALERLLSEAFCICATESSR